MIRAHIYKFLKGYIELSPETFFQATIYENQFIFFNNSLASVTTVTQTQVIFIVNYDTHILQNLCII